MFLARAITTDNRSPKDKPSLEMDWHPSRTAFDELAVAWRSPQGVLIDTQAAGTACQTCFNTSFLAARHCSKGCRD
eukprot:5439224-Amphidinium_carterae.1